MKINLVPSKPINQTRVEELLNECKATNHYTNNGPLTRLLEQLIREKLVIDDDKDIVIVSNGTVALWVAVAAIELHHDKKLRWATQSFTFPPSAQGILKDVLIVDIDEEGGLELTDDLHLSVDGIIVTNVFGNLVNIQKYVNWCEKFNKYLIFDNAATSYSFYQGKNSVNYGNCSTLSFHHTKPIGFGEGGAVIIDKKFSKELRRLINFGIDESHGWHRWGGNYKLSDVSCAYIIQHLETLHTIYNKTKSLFDYVIKRLPFSRIKLFPNFSDEIGLVSCLTLLYENSEESLEAIEKLSTVDIFSRKYYYPLVNSSNAVKIFDKIVCIPLHYCMTEEDMEYIINILFN